MTIGALSVLLETKFLKPVRNLLHRELASNRKRLLRLQADYGRSSNTPATSAVPVAHIWS